ncbi:acyl-CoA dehydrogenase family protein [Pseudochelatococcus sp. B33]
MTKLSDISRSDTVSLEQILSNIAGLAPMIAQLTPEMEQGRRLPEPIVSALKSAGIYGMVVPRRYGGLGLDAPSSFRAITALSRLDGSVGWNAMNGHLAALVPFLGTEALCEEVHRDGQYRLIAGSAQPAGRAERVPAGWRVTGSWPFASGCQDAEWIGGACIMMEGGAPVASPDGQGPMVRSCLLPAGDWKILDTWHAFGLRGTGSHHVTLTDAFVPDANFVEFPFGTSCAPDRTFTRFAEMMMLVHGAFAVGVAEGAIADLAALATSGVRQMFAATPLVETERFREGLGRLDAELKAARALFEAELARVWRDPEPRTGTGIPRVVGQLQTVVWVTAAAVRVAEGCLELAGSRAVYESSPLQRRLRDLHAASTHVSVHPRQYIPAGDAVLARLSNASAAS